MSSTLPPPPASSNSDPKKPFWTRRWFLISAGAIVVLAAIGSFLPQDESNSDSGAPAEASTSSDNSDSSDPTEPAASTTSPSTTALATTQATETTPTSVAPTSASIAPSPQPAAQVLMPVVPCGTDLQLAQDMIQAAGVFLSLSEDATGRGRMQILDRNWTVLYSTPDPGTPIDEGDAVFFVVKDEEFTGC